MKDPHEITPELNGSAEPREALEWAAATVERLAVTSSFQSSGLVIMHMLRDIRPDVPVLFLNTGFHFPETLAFVDRISEEWDLKLIEVHGEHGTPERQAEIHGPNLYDRDPDKCCAINKVEPLQRALEEYDGWISGIRRDQSAERAAARIIQIRLLRSGRGIFKVHPLANWTREDVDAYIAAHEIPTNPLLEKGFASIGCRPCTRPIRDGEDERAGRWEGLSKNECGIHTFGEVPSREVEGEQ
jgi:phosphoadenosine phosphosulfate reductase